MDQLSPAIELAARSDVPAILAIANQAAQDTAANFATEPEPLDDWLALYDRTCAQYPWLVARAGGEVVGFAKSGPYRLRGAYRFTAEVSVYVRPAWHRRGLGRALYARAIPMLRQQGFTALFASITSPHPPSERLHEAFGFSRIGMFHRCGWKFDRWHDVGFWELVLRPDDVPTAVQPVAAVWPSFQ